MHIYTRNAFFRERDTLKKHQKVRFAYIYARNEFFDDFLGGHTFPIRTYPTPFFHLMPRVTGCPLRENNLQKCFKKPFLGQMPDCDLHPQKHSGYRQPLTVQKTGYYLRETKEKINCSSKQTLGSYHKDLRALQGHLDRSRECIVRMIAKRNTHPQR